MNSDDSMNVIRHDHMCPQFDGPEMFRDRLPAWVCNRAEMAQSHLFALD